jgi:hypothetical protein
MASFQSLQIGDRVRLQNLISRSDLNGTISVILSHNIAKGREDVAGFPKTLSIKPENLVKVLEPPDSMDWSMKDEPNPVSRGMMKLGMKEISFMPNFRIMKDCTEYVKSVREYLYENEIAAGVKFPSVLFNRELASQILNNTAPHIVNFLTFDAVGHHLIIETYGGVARIWQCSIDLESRETSTQWIRDAQLKGYSVLEWMDPTSDRAPNQHCPAFIAARKRWGGGKFLSYKELSEYLDLLVALQDATNRAADFMYRHMPNSVQREQKEFDSGSRYGSEPSDPPFMEWSHEIHSNPHYLATYPGRPLNSEIVVESGVYYAGSREPFRIVIPSSIAGPVDAIYRQVFGHEVREMVFVCALNYKDYQLVQVLDDNSPTGTSHIGWSVRAAVVPK